MDNTAILGTIVAMGAVFYLIVLALAIFMIIAWWKVFEKAGEPGWKILIPVYNVYTIFKIARNITAFWVYLILAVVTVLVCSVLGGISVATDSLMPTYIAAVFYILFVIAIFVTMIILYCKLANAFGQGGGFAVGLIFLPVIFIPIIAFSSNIQYMEKQTNFNV